MTEQIRPEYTADGPAILAQINEGLTGVVADHRDYYGRLLPGIGRTMAEDLELGLGAFTDIVIFPSRQIVCSPSVVLFKGTITSRPRNHHPSAHANFGLFDALCKLITGVHGDSETVWGVNEVAEQAKAALVAKKSRAEMNSDGLTVFTEDDIGPLIRHKTGAPGTGILEGIQLRLASRLYANVRASNLYTLERPVGRSAVELVYRLEEQFPWQR